MAIAQLGSISHGTLRQEDLVPVCTDKLKELTDGNNIDAGVIERAEALEKDTDGYYVNSETAQDVLDDLFDSLDRYAPKGAYFGSLEGDGADFGFWEMNEDYYE